MHGLPCKSKVFRFFRLSVFSYITNRNIFFKTLSKISDTDFFNPERDPLGAGYKSYNLKLLLDQRTIWERLFTRISKLFRLFTWKTYGFYFYFIFWGIRIFGSLFILILYAIIVWRILKIGKVTRSNFGKLYCYSLATAFYICSGKYDDGFRFIAYCWVSLPIMSYGGSSMMAIMFGLGIAMSCKVYKDTPVN